MTNEQLAKTIVEAMQAISDERGNSEYIDYDKQGHVIIDGTWDMNEVARRVREEFGRRILRGYSD